MRISDWSSDVCSSDLALRENRLNRENILEIARGSLESLGYWPLPDVQPAQGESIAEPDAQAEQALADDVDRNVAAFIDRSIDQARTSQADDTQVDSAQVAPPIPVAAGGRGGFEITGDEIEDRKSTRLNSSPSCATRMTSSA